mgnify:CR=1 FL=1
MLATGGRDRHDEAHLMSTHESRSVHTSSGRGARRYSVSRHRARGLTQAGVQGGRARPDGVFAQHVGVVASCGVFPEARSRLSDFPCEGDPGDSAEGGFVWISD